MSGYGRGIIRASLTRRGTTSSLTELSLDLVDTLSCDSIAVLASLIGDLPHTFPAFCLAANRITSSGCECVSSFSEDVYQVAGRCDQPWIVGKFADAPDKYAQLIGDFLSFRGSHLAPFV